MPWINPKKSAMMYALRMAEGLAPRLLSVCFLPKTTLLKAVKKMVSGMRNLMMEEGMTMTSNAANAKVTLCPMVKAVTKMSTLRHCEALYTAQRATKNKMWSKPARLEMWPKPNLR